MIETGPLLIAVFTVLNFHTTTGSLTPFQVQNTSWRSCRKLHFRIHPVSELRAAIDSQGVNSLLPDPFTEVLQIHLPLSTRFNLPVKHFRAAPVLLRKWYFLTSCAHVVLQVRTQADWGGCCEEPPYPKLIPLGPKTKNSTWGVVYAYFIWVWALPEQIETGRPLGWDLVPFPPLLEVKENVADLESVIHCELTHYRLFSGMRPQQTWRHTLVYCEQLSTVWLIVHEPRWTSETACS